MEGQTESKRAWVTWLKENVGAMIGLAVVVVPSVFGLKGCVDDALKPDSLRKREAAEADRQQRVASFCGEWSAAQGRRVLKLDCEKGTATLTEGEKTSLGTWALEGNGVVIDVSGGAGSAAGHYVAADSMDGQVGYLGHEPLDEQPLKSVFQQRIEPDWGPDDYPDRDY